MTSELDTPVLCAEADLEALGYWNFAPGSSEELNPDVSKDNETLSFRLAPRPSRYAGLATACLFHLVVAGLIGAAPSQLQLNAEEEGAVVVSITVFGMAPEDSRAAAENPADPTDLPRETTQQIPQPVAVSKPFKTSQSDLAPKTPELLAASQPAKTTTPAPAERIIEKPAQTVAPLPVNQSMRKQEVPEKAEPERKHETPEIKAAKIAKPPPKTAEKQAPTKNRTATSHKSAASAKKGDAAARERKASAPLASKGDVKNRETGNASASNYLGKVNKALARARKKATGKGRGTTIVGFVINASGAISGLRLIASSGKAAMDKAALALVDKAAPFPPIPTEAGRTTWPMQVPIEFR